MPERRGVGARPHPAAIGDHGDQAARGRQHTPDFAQQVFRVVAHLQRMHEQDTVSTELKDTTIKARGRHDPCVLPRAVPMVEAMTALVLVDHALRHKAQCE